MKPRATEQKLRGGYYTPAPVAQFLASWAVRSAIDNVLEPSCGDGAFLDQLVAALRDRGATDADVSRQIHAVEFDAEEADKSRARLRGLGLRDPSMSVRTGDFFGLCRGSLGKRRFQAVVGNPPFVRYQHFPEEHRDAAFTLMRSAGLNPNGLTNAWVPFVCVATTLLTDDGRLAMVIPAELLQVSYSAELRRFLSDTFDKITMFTFGKLLFDDAQQEVVLVCAERKSASKGIDIVELTSADDLSRYTPRTIPAKDYKPIDHSTEKWIQYFLSKREVFLLRELRANPKLPQLGNLASVDVGVVTGLNEFFVLSDSDRAQRKLTSHTDLVVTRSAHLQGLIYGDLQVRAQIEQGARSHLLRLPATEFDRLPVAVKAYVKEGENSGFNLGYKCRIRKHWWVVPSVWIPDGFLLRQIHRYPKLVVNRAGATCTDTIHRVKMKNGEDVSRVAGAFFNSLTFAFAEVFGRSYGGGVLELEPTEAEHLPVPFGGAAALDLEGLHKLLLKERIDDALEQTDRILLKRALGLSLADLHCVRGIWRKLMGRRLGRKGTAILRPNQKCPAAQIRTSTARR